MKKILKISVITPTLNAEASIEHFLRSVGKQRYPKSKIELLVIDGGSTDDTLKIAKKHRAVIVPNPDKLAEPGVFYGMQKATGDIFIVLATDNIFKRVTAFKEITTIFEDPEIYAAFPKHISASFDSIYTKYVNMFTDPFNHFVYWDASNLRTFKKVYKTEKHTKTYDVYDYRSSRVMPILALAQGFSVRREFITKRKEKMDDIISVIEIIKQGKKMAYAFNVDLYHHTVRNLDHFIRKQRWTARNALNRKRYGISYRKTTLTTEQKLRTYLFIPYSLSVVFPVIVALYKATSEKNSVWLLHPFMTWLSAFSITWEVLIKLLNFNKDISKQ